MRVFRIFFVRSSDLADHRVQPVALWLSQGLGRQSTKLIIPEKLTFPSVLTKQCGVVSDMVDRWHHLTLLSLEIFYSQTESSVLLVREV